MTPSQKQNHTASGIAHTLRIEPEEVTKIVLFFGDKKISIPTPPIKLHNKDLMEVLGAAMIGLAIKCGIEPEENK